MARRGAGFAASLAVAVLSVATCGGSSTEPSAAGTPSAAASRATLAPSVRVTASPNKGVTPAPTPSVDVTAARLAFEYPDADREFVVIDSTQEAGVTIHDVTYESVGGRVVSAFLVVPDATGPFPAVLFLHWYATNEPDGNRTEFLDEAIDLAADGVVSLLPEQVFPWATPPSGATEDRQAVIDQVVDLRVGLDILLAQPQVDADRLAVVGHDFGGMYAALVGSLDDRIDGAAILAGVPRWADWYLRYWQPVPAGDEPAYEATMANVDPVTFLPVTEIPLLLQFSRTDQFVNQAAIDAWLAAAPDESTTVETYAWNHSLHTQAADAHRRAFLAAVLHLAD